VLVFLAGTAGALFVTADLALLAAECFGLGGRPVGECRLGLSAATTGRDSRRGGIATLASGHGYGLVGSTGGLVMLVAHLLFAFAAGLARLLADFLAHLATGKNGNGAVLEPVEHLGEHGEG